MADVENSNGASNKVVPEEKTSKTKVAIGDKEKKGIVRQVPYNTHAVVLQGYYMSKNDI